ncbi:MAG: hypothetical protein WBL95_16345 [Microcoleus sp.]
MLARTWLLLRIQILVYFVANQIHSLWNKPESLLSKNGAGYGFEYRSSSDRATVFGNAAGDILMILALRAIDLK